MYIKNYMNSLLLNGANGGYKNVSVAMPYVDYEPVSQIVRFQPGEITKKIYLLNASFSQTSSVSSSHMRMFTVQIKPLLSNSSLNLCQFINPDFINVVIQEEKLIPHAASSRSSILVGFNQTTSLSVNETSRFVTVPIVRTGDLATPFSVICHTRPQTAIENKDYVGRGSFEQWRIYFEPGERVKYCQVELINDAVFEADEIFQIRLSDLRGPADISFNQFNVITVTILNDEDCKY